MMLSFVSKVPHRFYSQGRSHILLFCIPIISACSSCKKQELRSTTYSLRAFNNSGLSGFVTFQETNSINSTVVKLTANGVTPNTVYLTHLHTGTPGNLTGTLIYFKNLQSTTNTIVREETWAETYDNALQSNTCVTMHNPFVPFSNDTTGYALAGNTGANAP